jgi:hypothetical protein
MLVVLIPQSREKDRGIFFQAIQGCFAEFTLSHQSEILRFAQNGSEGLSMTEWTFSATC